MNELRSLLKKARITRLYWSMRNGLFFIRTYLYTLTLMMREVHSAFWSKRVKGNERDALAIRIRKRAHQVERVIMLHSFYAGRQRTTDFLTGELVGFIGQWRARYEDCDFVRFAERIVREYKELFRNRKGCPMIKGDAVANADVPLKDTAVGKFLCESGYTGRSPTAKKVDEIIDGAMAIRKVRA